MKQTLQVLLVTAFGAIASLLTVVILFVVEDQFGFAFYSFMLWFVVPIGAILSGFVAAGGGVVVQAESSTAITTAFQAVLSLSFSMGTRFLEV